MKRNSTFLLLMLQSVLYSAFAQTNTVTGVVSDPDGQALPGVSVLVQGATEGTSTDNDGMYSIEIPGDNTVLVFSFIGFITKEVPVNGQAEIMVRLEPQSELLTDVVVVGYSKQSKATVTGSVSMVKGELLEKAPVVNLSSNLSGRIPGLTAMNTSGEPGRDGATLRIRGMNTLGNNNPLIVIDGVANRGGGLERIDPNDVESISVLKDASAAIYGAQAANGVILVTTKRGTKGRTQINYSYNHGFTQPTRLPEMADAATYAVMMNELAMYRGGAPVYTEEEIGKFRDGSDPLRYPDTDWFEEVIKPVSHQNNHSVSMSGGTEKLTYYLSMGLQGQDAFYYNSATRYNQQSLRANIDFKVSDYVNLGFNVLGRQEIRNQPIMSSGWIYEELMIGKPTSIGRWPGGEVGPPVRGNNNPIITVTDAAGYNRLKDYYLQNNLQLQLKNPWIENLTLTLNGTFDKNFSFSKLFSTPFTTYVWDNASMDDNGNPVLTPLTEGDPSLNESMEDGQQITVNGILNYTHSFGNHNLAVLGGMERYSSRSDNFSAFRRYFISTAIDQLFAGSDVEKDNGGSAWHAERLNYFGRINYDFKKKYLFEFLWRYDGSYIFPENKRFGFFPGVMAGWQISEEDFWKQNLPFFNFFKLRASWGQTGNDRINEYQYLSSFAFGSSEIFGITNENKTIYPSRIANPNVTWEIANQANIGIEGEMFESRIAFEIDYFNNKRTNILWYRNASVPAYTGLTLPRENIGKVRNTGFDYMVSYRNNKGDFSYNFTFIGGYAKNKILFWDETPGVEEWQRSTGRPMETSLYYKAIGVFNTEEEVENYPHWSGARAGDLIFEDINGDGEINASDRIRIDKTTLPTFTGGFSVDLSFKRVDLSIALQGASGAARYIKTLSGDVGNYTKEFAENRWTPDNPESEHPRTYNREEQYWVSQPNTYFLRSSDYIRLKSMQIGYTFPEKITSKAGVSNFRIYVSGFNLFTIDKLKVFDPESTHQAGYYYPQQKVYNLGATLTF